MEMEYKLIDYWAFNLKHLIKRWRDNVKYIHDQMPLLFKAILEKWFLLNMNDPYFSNTTIVEFAWEEGGYKSIFEYLEVEK